MKVFFKLDVSAALLVLVYSHLFYYTFTLICTCTWKATFRRNLFVSRRNTSRKDDGINQLSDTKNTKKEEIENFNTFINTKKHTAYVLNQFFFLNISTRDNFISVFYLLYLYLTIYYILYCIHRHTEMSYILT